MAPPRTAGPTIQMNLRVPPDVHEAMRLMRQHSVRRLPVLEDGQIAGIVSLGDLAMQDEPDLAFAQLSAIAVAV